MVRTTDKEFADLITSVTRIKPQKSILPPDVLGGRILFKFRGLPDISNLKEELKRLDQTREVLK